MTDKEFINDPSQCVDDSLAGLLASSPSLTKIASHPHCIITSSPPAGVPLISGGGSGHEPAHVGYVASGMLSGAVCGGCFASPSIAEILATVLALTSSEKPSCLLVVKNYTGDVLNFTLAAKKANTLHGRDVRIVVIADDCAVPLEKGITGRRGVAGTIFVHKCAGAVAAEGGGVDEVVAAAEMIKNRLLSLGVSLTGVTIPGQPAPEAMAADKFSLGMGIHGEAGVSMETMKGSKGIVKSMCDLIVEYGYDVSGNDQMVKVKAGDEVAVMVNNLGGASTFELYVVANDVCEYFKAMGVVVKKCYVGSFMTSFNMRGVSTSLLVLNGEAEKILGWLDAPTTSKAWQMAETMTGEKVPEPSIDLGGEGGDVCEWEEKAMSGFADGARKAIEGAVERLSAEEGNLTKWDQIVGDGDCGITIKRGAEKVKEMIAAGKVSFGKPAQMMSDLAEAAGSSMGGTSGVLFEIFFRKCCEDLKAYQEGGGKAVDEAGLRRAFVAGVKEVELSGGAGIGSRTMNDALIPAAEVCKVEGNGIDSIVKAAAEGAEGTKEMEAKAGRSNYLAFDTIRGTPDPGSKAVQFILEGIASGLS
ncbi:hypothetical protein TrST_g1040 [Triparma strigata]|uniref:Uncharacterized protein n=1 Tax=Triparma strigata TaxID=1606541 RepID=A0A9W7DZ01_9STRA|nr:hypothetical protein TrST_g1040 [Triparma strigata]